MKHVFATAVLALAVSQSSIVQAQEITLVAPGGMRCPLDRLEPDFLRQLGFAVKITIGSGGSTHQQVVKGVPFDVPIVQPPYQDVLDSGNVVASSETPLATVPIVVVVKKGNPLPDVSTADAIKKMLLAAKATSYPDGAGGLGGAAGVSIDKTLKQLGIYEQVQPKVKRMQGVSLMQLVTRGDIDVALTYSSEVNDPGVTVVGQLPRDISTPTALVGFVSAHTKAPADAKALLSFLASPDAAVAYKACAMQAGR